MFFDLYGRRGSGKGTLLEVLQAVAGGKEAVGSLTTSALTNKNARYSLIGKKLAVDFDASGHISGAGFLKLPSTYGREYSNAEVQQNGRLQILGAANGQFAKIDYQPPMNLRDFYIFPYDMRHCVYPFNGTKETRRTLVCNVDVDYNPVSSRTGSGQNE